MIHYDLVNQWVNDGDSLECVSKVTRLGPGSGVFIVYGRARWTEDQFGYFDNMSNIYAVSRIKGQYICRLKRNIDSFLYRSDGDLFYYITPSRSIKTLATTEVLSRMKELSFENARDVLKAISEMDDMLTGMLLL